MIITFERRVQIQQEIEQALMEYHSFKEGRPVHWKNRAYLSLLSEGDYVGNYLIRAISDKKQHTILKLYTQGWTFEALVNRNGTSPAQIKAWIDDLNCYIIAQFLKLNSFDCPFCNGTRKSKSLGVPRPINGHVCYCRELRWAAEQAEQEEYDKK